MQITVTTEIGTLLPLSEKALSLYLNGFEYHRDRDKREQIEALFRVIPEGPSRALFLHLVIDKVAAIGQLMWLVQLLEGKRDSLRLMMAAPRRATPPSADTR